MCKVLKPGLEAEISDQKQYSTAQSTIYLKYHESESSINLSEETCRFGSSWFGFHVVHFLEILQLKC